MEYIFEVGGFSLRWYSVLVALGLGMGAWIAAIEAKRRGEDPNHVFSALLICLPTALICARAYHVIDQWNELYSDDVIRALYIWEGGIGIYGAAIGSILGLAIYTRWQRLPLLHWLDIGAPGFILGQAIGRWGNFFNQELYGTPTDLPWAINIDASKRASGYETFSQFHPLFLYESLLNLAGLGVMLYVARRFADRLKDGDIVLIYGVWYGGVRLGLEWLRIDNWVAGGFPVAAAISIAAIVVCGGVLLYRHWYTPRYGGAAKAA